MSKFWSGEQIPPSGPERTAWFWSGFKSTASINFLTTPVGEWDSDQHYRMPKPKRVDNRPRKTDRKNKPYRVPVYEWESETGHHWMDEAACAETNLLAFTPTGVREYKKNQAWAPFCNSCPVAKQCLQYGRESGSQGVWGGVFIDDRGDETNVDGAPLQSE